LRIPTLRDLVFSAKAYLAAAVALFIGFSQGLEKPYWAVLTIYSVLTPPESGAIRSKAMFRLIGTLAGGVMMIGLTALFGDQLGILVTATIAVVTLATFLRQADRTPSNYLWFSTGITMAVIGLTNLMQPENVFAATTARVAEITLGILVVTAVDAMFWPRPMTPDFLDTMTKWRGDVQHWVLDALSLTAAQTSGDERRMALRQGLRDLTKAVGEIDGKAVQLPYDVVAVVPRRRQIDLVRRQTVSLIADLAGIEIWARSLRRDLLLHSHLGAVLDAVSDWVRESHAVGHSQAVSIATRGDALIADLQARRAALDPRDGRTTLTERGLITRLAAFVRDWSDLLLALRSVETGEALPPPRRDRPRGAARAQRRLSGGGARHPADGPLDDQRRRAVVLHGLERGRRGLAVLADRLRVPDRAGAGAALERRADDVDHHRLCVRVPLSVRDPAPCHRFSGADRGAGVPAAARRAVDDDEHGRHADLRLRVLVPRASGCLCRGFQPEPANPQRIAGGADDRHRLASCLQL
jgi:hypothetical protein